ncbi:MAG: hypothetical protein WA118_01825 [Carboxydocellales bacterium]
MALRTVIKNLGLAKEYLSMSPAEKKLLDKYHYTGEVISVVQRETSKQDDPFLGEAFRVDTAIRLLWVTAANAIPHGQWHFAEKLLHQALELADDSPDSFRDCAHIYANLAQLYADQVRCNPAAAAKCLHHARETIKTGYFVVWAQNLCREIEEKSKRFQY